MTMMFWWPLLLIVLVAAVAWLAQRGGASRPSAGEDRAQAILRERFARGEIDEESYRRQTEALRHS